MKSLVLVIVCILSLNIGCFSAAAPAVKVTSPADGAVSLSRTVTVTGTASGSDAGWSSGSSSDFNAGEKLGVLVNGGGDLVLDHGMYDDFNDNSLDLTRWTKLNEVNGASISESGGRLRFSLQSTGSSYWACRGDIISTVGVASYVSADLASFSGSGSGYATGLLMYQDDNNLVLVGQTYDPGAWGDTVRVLFTTIASGAMQERNVKEATAGLHNYCIEYSAGTVTALQDGTSLGSKAMSLSGCKVAIYNAALLRTDVLNAEYDNVKVDYTSGAFISEVFDTLSADPVLKRVGWNDTTPSGTAIEVAVRSSDFEDMTGTTGWKTVTNGQTSSLPAVKRYLQYRATLSSPGRTNTPVFEDISFVYNKPVAKVEVSIDGQGSWTAATGTSSWTAIVVLPENSTVVWVRATDVAGEVNLTSLRVEVDTTPPRGGIKINQGAAFTTQNQVTLSLGATDKYGVASMVASESADLSGLDWEDYSATKDFSLSSGDGPKTVYVKFRDANGWESAISNATIVLDTLPPVGNIVVEGGAVYTRNSTVNAALNASDPIGLDGMMLSTDPLFQGAQWATFAAETQIALPPGSGERAVYVKFRDRGGHVSQPYSDTILQDQSPPVVTLTCDDGAAYTRSANVAVALAARENYEVVSMQLGEGEGTTLTMRPWAPFSPSNNLTLSQQEGRKTISARLTDVAGNVGAANSTTIVLDYTAPRTTVGALAASSPRARLDVGWSATDATSGVLWYDVQYRAGNGTWKDLLSRTNLTSTQFTGEDLETYSFRARAQDRAGNLEDYPATVDNAIAVRLPEPAVTYIKPGENAELSGKTTVAGACAPVPDGRTVSRVEWRVDNGTWTAADGTLNWSFRLDTTKFKDGRHTLQVRTFDGKHVSTAVEMPFRVKNAQAKGFIGADGALLLVACTGIMLALAASRRR